MRIRKESAPLGDLLSTCLSNVTIMYHRVHGFHWNVVGGDFPQWHSKFEEIYEDVYDSIDPLAENIRKVGVFAPFTLSALTAFSSVSDISVDDFTAQNLVDDLLRTNEGVLESLKDAFDMATSLNEQGIANFLADRIDAHSKWAWQLSVSLEG